jgi:hypothetical protein
MLVNGVEASTVGQAASEHADGITFGQLRFHAPERKRFVGRDLEPHCALCEGIRLEVWRGDLMVEWQWQWQCDTSSAVIKRRSPIECETVTCEP